MNKLNMTNKTNRKFETENNYENTKYVKSQEQSRKLHKIGNNFGKSIQGGGGMRKFEITENSS